jgi:hypothetical protein
MPAARMGDFSEYHVTIGERTYVAVASSRGRVIRGEGPLDRFVGKPVGDLTRACRRRGYPVSLHDRSGDGPSGGRGDRPS